MTAFRYFTGKSWSSWYHAATPLWVYRGGAKLTVRADRVRPGDMGSGKPDADGISPLLPIVAIETRVAPQENICNRK